MSARLHTYWNDFAINLGASTEKIETIWDWIESAYSEPHRHYHTLDHIDWCLHEFDWCRRGFSKESSDVVEFAIWFHDIVYDTMASDNKEQSAKLARNALGVLGVGDQLFRAKLTRLINCTKHIVSEISIVEEEDVLLDIDLSILGSDPEVFDQYEKNIRKEYEWVPYEMYCAGRVEILQSFLVRPKIFRSPMFQFVEEQARENIARSVKICST
ncbi:MAG TPA: hypothetical protein VI423_06595 [Paenisporosarcina sp.]|nr:hypothetical protein [Paenisporosarcina sp.]